MFRTVPLPITRNFSLYTQQWYMSYRFADSLLSANMYVDGHRNCPKHAEFYSKNKFEKLVHLVGFIIRKTKYYLWNIRKLPSQPSACLNETHRAEGSIFKALIPNYISRMFRGPEGFSLSTRNVYWERPDRYHKKTAQIQNLQKPDLSKLFGTDKTVLETIGTSVYFDIFTKFCMPCSIVSPLSSALSGMGQATCNAGVESKKHHVTAQDVQCALNMTVP